MNSLHFFVELLRIRELFAKYFCFEWKIGNDPMKEETLLWIESYLTVLPPTIPIKKTHGPFFAYLSNYFYLGKNRMVIKFGSCSFWRMRKKMMNKLDSMECQRISLKCRILNFSYAFAFPFKNYSNINDWYYRQT